MEKKCWARHPAHPTYLSQEPRYRPWGAGDPRGQLLQPEIDAAYPHQHIPLLRSNRECGHVLGPGPPVMTPRMGALRGTA